MIELRTLGDCQILVGGERLGPQSPHAFALALFLAVERGRPHARDELLAMFFPGVPEGNAAHSLRQTLYKLRQLGVPAETTPAGTMLAASEVRDDYSALMATGELPDARTARLPGQFLPGYWPRISDEFARWLEGQRDAVGSALRRAYVSRILDRRAVARWDEVERYARACLVVDPLNEEATLALAEALALSGSKAAGVKVLDRYLEEVGREDDRLTLPATVLRKRISERVQVRSGRYGLFPLVGRDDELRFLSKLTSDARAGQPRAALIIGEPGIGKTRLIREHAATLQVSNARILEAGCQPHDSRRPMSVLVDLVPQLVRCTGAMGAAPSSLALLNRLCKVDGEHSVPIVMPGASADELAATVTDALSDVLDAIAADHLLVLLIEDLHWADALSQRVMLHLVGETKHRRLLTIFTSRDDFRHTFTTGAPALLRLQGLSASDSAHLVQSLLTGCDEERAPHPIAQILQLASGNPFYLRTLCEYFREEGTIDKLPPILTDILSQRLAALSQLARTAFAACVILGRWSTLPRLEEVLAVSAVDLAQALAEVEGAGLVTYRADRVEIQHALLATSVMSTESVGRLSVVQRAVARVLEHEADRTGAIALYWDAADLWVTSGDSHRAQSALRTCALHAAHIGAAQDAVQAMERFGSVASDAEAVELCDLIRTTILRDFTGNDRLLHDWRGSPRSSHRPAFRRDFDLLAYEVSRQHSGDGEQHLGEMLELVGDPTADRRARVRAASMAICVAGDIDDRHIAEQIMAALEITPEDYWDRDPDMVRFLLAYHTDFGDRTQASRLVRIVSAWPDDVFLKGDSIRSLSNAGMASMLSGDVPTSFLLLDRAYRLAFEGGLMAQASIAAARRCWISRQIGDSAEAGAWALRARSTSHGIGIAAMPTHALYVVTLLAIDKKEIAQARSLMSDLERRTAFWSRSNHWAVYTAMKLRISALSEAAEVSDEHLAAVHNWSLRTADRVPEDDIALGVAIGLSQRDAGRAQEFLDTYLSRRRAGLPVLPHLSQLYCEA